MGWETGDFQIWIRVNRLPWHTDDTQVSRLPASLATDNFDNQLCWCSQPAGLTPVRQKGTTMSMKNKAFAIAAAAAVATAFSLTSGLPVQASTTACGTSCSSPTNQAIGTAVTPTITISGGGGGSSCPSVTAAGLQQAFNDGDGNPLGGSMCTINVGMAATSTTNAGQDWLVMDEGQVNAFVSGQALSPRLGIQYGGDDVFEFQAAPNGVPSGLCLANVESSLTDSPALSLSTCGESTTTAPTTAAVSITYSETAWIADENNDTGGFEDLISGNTQAFSLPSVLTATANGTKYTLSLQTLSEINGVVAPSEMWSFTYGPQSAAALKKDGLKHT